MTTLVTGGTGKTGLAVARLLHAANYPVLITSRKGVAPEPFKAVKFDWHDQSTFENPFNADANIDRVYLVAPNEVDCLALMKPFIDLAITKGVKRFVLITVTQAEKGGPFYGKVHEYLADIGIDYVVLRPTWFMGVCSWDPRQRFNRVGNEDRPPSACCYRGHCASRVQRARGREERQHRLLCNRPGALVLRRGSRRQQQTDLFKYLGMSDEFSALLSDSEVRLEEGSEEAIVGNTKAIVGKRRLRDYLEANKKVWIKGSSLL